MKNLKNYKIDVSGLTEAQRAEVQKAAFKLGYKWYLGKVISYTKSPCYFLYKDGCMSYLISMDKAFFDSHQHTQITPQQLIDMAYPKPKFTFAETILFIMDCKKNNAMPGRDTVRQLCNVSEFTARKALNLVKAGFDKYFHSKERVKRFKTTKSHIPVNERLAEINDADLANFAEMIKV